MSTATPVSMSDYLATSYRPDRDYVDGELLERNVGEWDHSRLQALLLKHLLQYEDTFGLLVVAGQRVQVMPSRFRIPDLCVVRGNPGQQILTRPPLLCIEILSPDDRMSSMQERIEDFLALGVENVWIVDPRRKKAYWADSAGVHEATTGILEAAAAPIHVDLHALWPV